MTSTFTIEHGTDLGTLTATFEIEFTATPYDPGRAYGPAENCHPPEGGEVEVGEITLKSFKDEDDKPIVLTAEGEAMLIAWVEANHMAEIEAACEECEPDDDRDHDAEDRDRDDRIDFPERYDFSRLED